LHIEFGFEAAIKMPYPPILVCGFKNFFQEIGAPGRYRQGARLIPSLEGKKPTTAKSQLKNAVFNVQPLKGRLIEMAFGIAKAMP
jgi:hypothetical protein